MKSFIEELYYGNIDPQNSGFEDDAGVQRELRTISENEDWLTEHLTDEEKKRFLDFADAWSAYNGDATLDGFITGFRLGARFVLDTFLHDETAHRYCFLSMATIQPCVDREAGLLLKLEKQADRW